MEKIRNLRTSYAVSLREFASPRGLTLCGLMCALAIVLNLTARIDIGEYIRISFSGLANRVVECLLGPIVGSFFGAVTDILNFIVKPSGAFFPGFTLNKMLEGALFGAILYKKPITVPRIFVAQLLVKAIVNCGFNTLWLCVMYGEAMGTPLLIKTRIIKNAVMLPIDTLITFLLLTAVVSILKRLRGGAHPLGQSNRL